MSKPAQNPDRVTPPVAQLGLAGVVLAAIARALIDRYVDPADRELWWNIFQTFVVPLVVLLGAWIGAQRAKRNVTPVLTSLGDVPRDRRGRELRPVDHQNPAAGYPTRAADPSERPRREPPETRYP